MAKKETFRAPNIENVTDGAIVDELGKIKQIAKWAKFMEGFYKEALYGRLEKKAQSLPAGEKYSGTVSEETDTRIIADLVRQYVTEDILAKVTVSKPKFVMRITPTEVDLIQLDSDLKNLMMELGLDDEEYN